MEPRHKDTKRWAALAPVGPVPRPASSSSDLPRSVWGAPEPVLAQNMNSEPHGAYFEHHQGPIGHPALLPGTEGIWPPGAYSALAAPLPPSPMHRPPPGPYPHHPPMHLIQPMMHPPYYSHPMPQGYHGPPQHPYGAMAPPPPPHYMAVEMAEQTDMRGMVADGFPVPVPVPSPSRTSRRDEAGAAGGNRSVRHGDLAIQLRHALDITESMFPKLSYGVRSVLLCVVLDEWLSEHVRPGEIDFGSGAVLNTLHRFTSTHHSASACQAKLEEFRDSYLDGTLLKDARDIRVRVGGRQVETLRSMVPGPVFSVTTASREVAMAAPQALKPITLDLQEPPKDGWLVVNGGRMAQTQVMHAAHDSPPQLLQGFMKTPTAMALASKALQNLDTACNLLGDGSGVGLSGLSLSGDIDFGIQPVIKGDPNRVPVLAEGPRGLLDALLLGGSAACAEMENAALKGTESALVFAQMTIAHQGEGREAMSSNGTGHSRESAPTGSSTQQISMPVWLMGGVAAPQLPCTFAALDSARLFWSEGHSSLRLDAGQQHTITVALCRLDGEKERKGESGVMQQALMFFFAVPSSSEAFKQLPRVKGAAYVDIFHPQSPAPSSGATSPGSLSDGGQTSGGTQPIATVGVARTNSNSRDRSQSTPPYRIFVCARRVSVALLNASQQNAASQLHVDAKLFLPPRLKKLFDNEPTRLHCDFTKKTVELLVADPKAMGVSAAKKKRFAHAEQQVQGLEALTTSVPIEGPPESMLRVLRRYHRLLHLEEVAMEEDICRHDQFNARFSLALFAHSNPRRYSVLRIASSEEPTEAAPSRWLNNDIINESSSARLQVSSSTNETPIKQQQGRGLGRGPSSKGIYRGPAVDQIFGSPFAYLDDQSEMYMLGMLRVPGLPEGRPSLVIGDCVHVRPCGEDTEEFVGLVAATDASSDVFLVMPQRFWALTGLRHAVVKCGNILQQGLGDYDEVKSSCFDGRVHVRFSFDRRPLSHMRTALIAAGILAYTRLVPPLASAASGHLMLGERKDYMQPPVAKVEAVAEEMEGAIGRSGRKLNREQRHAVAAVICGAGRAAPYGIHGPPGTGKTISLVALSLEIRAAYPESRLLCCAPQNYSADLLCSALATSGLGPDQLLRLNDPRRPPYSMKEDVTRYARINDETGMFELPPQTDLANYGVVVSTCAAAALLLPTGARPGDPETPGFTHVLIDEGGQALLPEALIPLVLLRPNGAPSTDTGWGAVVCGDPQQLGPTVRSPAAATSGLSSSLLERLISAHTEAAADLISSGRSPATSMLVANYRSHASLLHLPSKLFYRGQLLAAADPRSVLPPKWGELCMDEESGNLEESENGIEFENSSLASLMFYGVRGQQAHEGDVPSYHNALEAAAVADLVEGLLHSSAGVVPTDIGVMATYRRQVHSIRILFRQRGLGSVRVGTVDDYQVLIEDPSWRELVRHCAVTGAFRGAGAAALAERLGVVPVDNDEFPLLHHDGNGDGTDECDYGDGAGQMAAAIDQMAALALLGAGDASLIYPETLEEMHAAYSEEMEWRIML